MRKLKILHTVSVRWWNACAYYAVTMAEAMRDAGHEVYLASDSGSPPYEQAVKRNLNTIPVQFASQNPLLFLKEKSRLKKFIRAHEIKYINCHRPEDHLMTGLIAPGLNIPLIRTVGDIRPPRANVFNTWLHLKATQHFIFSCEANQVRYQSVWPEVEQHASIILGGVDLNEFAPGDPSYELRRELGIPDDAVVVGIVGRLSKNKDFPTFIRAAKLVHHQYPDTHFIISGAEFSVKRSELRTIASELDISGFIHLLDRSDSVPVLMKAFDIGVISSNSSEAITRVGMEYMACGLPVVATDVNVLPEAIVDGVNGFIVHPSDAEDLARGILQLRATEQMRKKIGAFNAADARKRFNLQTAGAETIEIYRGLPPTSGQLD
jgi:glycosyltransferase involved in cell wall biosynthesis